MPVLPSLAAATAVGVPTNEAVGCAPWCMSNNYEWEEKCVHPDWVAGRWCTACPQCATSSRAEGSLHIFYKPAVQLFHGPSSFSSDEPDAARLDPCHAAPWPAAAKRQGENVLSYRNKYFPRTLWVWLNGGVMCMAGSGWATRAQSIAHMLARGMERRHASANASSSAPLPTFSRVIAIDLSDHVGERDVWGARGGDRVTAITDVSPVELAFACAPVDCEHVALLPTFNFVEHHEAGVGDFALQARLVAQAGSAPPLENKCVWMGNAKTSWVRREFVQLAKQHPDVFALASADGAHLSMPEQARRWACFIDLPGHGYLGRVPLLLHSGRPLIILHHINARKREWFTDPSESDRLRPEEHYLEASLDSVLGVATRLLADTWRAARLGAAGQAYARRRLTREAAEDVAVSRLLAAGAAPAGQRPVKLAAVMYLNMASDRARRRRLLCALRLRGVLPEAERVAAFPMWRSGARSPQPGNAEITTRAGKAIARIPRCLARLHGVNASAAGDSNKVSAPATARSGGSGGGECTAAAPRCCFDARWTGAQPCEHKNMYDPKLASKYSLHACSALTGHSLTFLSALERVAERHRSGKADGLVLILEDDVLPDPFWSKRLVDFLVEQPPHAWDLAKLHGGLQAPLPSAWRQAIKDKALGGHEWASQLPLALWGTASVLLHSSKAAKVLEALRSQPLAPEDVMLSTAWAEGQLEMSVSRDRVFAPRPDDATTMESAPTHQAMPEVDWLKWRHVGRGCCRVDAPRGQEEKGTSSITATMMPRWLGSNSSTLAECEASCAADAQCAAFDARHCAGAEYDNPSGGGCRGQCWHCRTGGRELMASSCEGPRGKGSDEQQLEGGGATSCFARRTPSRPFPTAVCVLGAWRSFGRTAASIRRHVLEPLDADAFGVIELPFGPQEALTRATFGGAAAADAHERQEEGSRAAAHGLSVPHSVRGCEELLGPRVHGRCRVSFATSLGYDPTAMSLLDGAPARACFRRGVRTTAYQRHVWLQQHTCLGMVRNEEGARGGARYGAYLRLRTDMEVFEPLPPPFLRRPGPSEAVIPSGDDWGEDPAAGKQVADNMLLAGGDAFEADANVWRHAAEDGPHCTAGWIPEAFLGRGLARGGVAVTRAPLAYCKLDAFGVCRYLGQLALSHARVPGLVARRPSTAHWLCDRVHPPCDSASQRILVPQTEDDRKADPNWCKLRAALDSTCQASRRVLALVLSANTTRSADVRAHIRESYFRAMPPSTRALFVVGGLPRGTPPRVDDARQLLLLPTNDSYAGGSSKVLDAFSWALTSATFDVLLKLDDDTFLCPPLFGEWLRRQQRQRLYAGQEQVWDRSRPGPHTHSIRVFQSGRWADNAHRRMFGDDWYPRYMLGGGYALSRDVVRALVRRATVFGLFGEAQRAKGMPTMEDALVGRLAQGFTQYVPMPAFAMAFPNGVKDRAWSHPEQRCTADLLLFHPIDFSVVEPWQQNLTLEQARAVL